MSLLGGHKVWFDYSKETITIKKNKQNVQITRPVTKCTIQTEQDELVSSAIVKLYHNDKNNKVVGRECAFRKAVGLINNKDIRHNIRKDFRNNLKHI